MTPQTIDQDITMSQDTSAELACTPTTDDIKVAAEGFLNLNLSEDLLKAIADMNFSTPSSIQAEAIPKMISGIDLIAQAPTGSGKTAAFAIPILERLDMNRNNRDVQALVLCPTRELAIQVHREFEKLTKYMDNIAVVSVYGGQPIDRQLTALRKNPQIVVATPGRLMDHLRRGSVRLDALNMVVLDEADEMLDMGFRDDIHTILEDTPENRQTVLFSATMAKDIIAITKKFQKSPIIVDVMDSLQSIPDIEQVYYEVSEKGKVELLTRLLDLHSVKLGLVFCNTKSNVDRVVEILKVRGYFSDSLHGDMNQSQREKVMRGFRNGSVEILVATDVAGRGIDVKNIEAVFNYDLPRDDEDYIHRVGRTGRAGESGKAFAFVTRNQVSSIRRIERANGVLINKKEIPSFEELEAARVNTYETKIKNLINCDDLTEYVNKIEAMVTDEMSLVQIAAALLKSSMNKESKKINKNIVFEDSFSDDSEGRGRGRSRGGRNDRGRGGFGGDRGGRGSFGGDRGGFGERNSRGGSGFGRDRNSGGSRDGVRFERPERIQENNSNEIQASEVRAPRSFNRNSEGRSSEASAPRSYDRNADARGAGWMKNDKNSSRRNTESKPRDEFSLDNMIQSVKELSDVKKGRFSRDEKSARPARAGSPDKKFNYGSSKQNKDYRGKKKSFSSPK